ncbi:methylmalonyl Co-A mutase-associated GTPase MeaB [Abyssibius alkaniclasticus]|uniref:methylmalonyl Co-A mutase-associated GTPase MeaB n=1 Tax=Abyssibius alkaniclasticus TaxID=2881234 RepID=UPI004059443D
MSVDPPSQSLAQAVLQGERRALARAITLIESTRADHRAQAAEVLAALAGAGQAAIRIGLSGTPGVGKSTFIEAFGLHLIAQGLRVAVLAVDPSSTRSGGSILGDKTRMELLSRAPEAFIRPSPSQTALGGVARRTRESIALCAAAGFDVVLVETVGVGQSETIVAEMTDIFALLLAPAGGDELQGVKRGIMEVADLILINKADGDLEAQARRTVADYAAALRLLRKRAHDPEGFPRVMPVSALTGAGLKEAWQAMQSLFAARQNQGSIARRRKEQALEGFRRAAGDGLLAQLKSDPAIARAWAEAEARVSGDTASPDAALSALLDALAKRLGAG